MVQPNRCFNSLAPVWLRHGVYTLNIQLCRGVRPRGRLLHRRLDDVSTRFTVTIDIDQITPKVAVHKNLT